MVPAPTGRYADGMKTAIIAELVLREAARRGALDNLPGKGQPQEHDALVGLDEDARLDAILRATTGGASVELELRREVATLRDQLADTTLDEATRAELRAKLTDKVVRLSVVHESNGHPLLANAALDFMPG